MIGRIGRYLVLSILGIVWLLPIYLLLANSSKSNAGFSGTQLWTTGNLGDFWANVVLVFTTTDVSAGFGVSAIYAIIAPVIAVILGACIGFAVIVLKLKHGFAWFFIVFCGTVFPIQMMLIPWFSFYANSGMYDTIVGMIIIYSIVALPFSAFVMRNFFAGIAETVFEASVVDGANMWQIFTRIYLPMSTSALVVVFILQATWVWNDFLLSLILTQSDARPLMPLLNALQSTQGGGPGYTVTLTAALLVSVPTAVLFLFTQKFFQKGLTLGQY
ncbi:carbohydrate ABC transporter permease [Rathayibacter soli]|uniref:carbohydrate ABC transporter permease n=1 Tax=Rathayibacter soli TaxID=3144168 RepID=UPI0027E4ECC7|nr:carbohydrate ABC transporter permease [Glaciibacter superstes]